MDTALRTLELQRDGSLAYLVREVGPALAAPELVAALAEATRSELRPRDVYVGLVGRLKAKLPHEATVSERGADNQPPTDVDPAWRALAEEIGFLPALDDLAVVVHGPSDFASIAGAVDHVEHIATRLERAGRSHSAIALAAVEVPAEFETAIFEAGAQLLVVDPSFMEMSDAERISNLQSLLDDDPYEPPSGRPEHGVDEGLYDLPNPALTAEELSDWERRVQQSVDSD